MYGQTPPRDVVIHDLKTWPEVFERVWNGEKPFEVRKNDRDFQEGDLVRLREWRPEAKEYTGRSVRGRWGLPNDVCVFALRQACRTIETPREE